MINADSLTVNNDATSSVQSELCLNFIQLWTSLRTFFYTVSSRLVAQQVRSEAVFAAMLTVEAIRTIASLLATALPGEDFKRHGPQRIQVSVVDIKRAYFIAVVLDDEPQNVQLPAEDPEHERCEGKGAEVHVRIAKRRKKDGRNTTRTSWRRWAFGGVVLALASSCIQRDRYI